MTLLVKGNRFKTKKFKFIIGGIFLLIIICFIIKANNDYQQLMSYEQEYIDKAKHIALDYGIKDAEIKMLFSGTIESYREYELNLKSEEFENLSNEQKYDFINELEEIEGEFDLVSPLVDSHGNEYKIILGTLDKNGDYISLEDTEYSTEDDFTNDPNHQGQFEQDLDAYGDELQAENDTGNYSGSDEAVWQYCEDRWDYYDRLEGGYSGDKYTDQVFADAASKFGISSNEAYLRWQSVEQKKLGL